MSLDAEFETLLRRIIREEMACLLNDKPEDLLKPEDVRRLLNLNSVQKVYALVRENQLDAIKISQREMRFAPSAVREFQLKKGIRAA